MSNLLHTEHPRIWTYQYQLPLLPPVEPFLAGLADLTLHSYITNIERTTYSQLQISWHIALSQESHPPNLMYNLPKHGYVSKNLNLLLQKAVNVSASSEPTHVISSHKSFEQIIPDLVTGFTRPYSNLKLIVSDLLLRPRNRRDFRRDDQVSRYGRWNCWQGLQAIHSCFKLRYFGDGGAKSGPSTATRPAPHRTRLATTMRDENC